MRTRNRSRQCHVERLEQRELLSWLPNTIPYTINMPPPSNDRAMYNDVLAVSGTVYHPVFFQQFTFAAPRTGLYTIRVDDTGSHTLAPIFAIWQAPGREIGYCYQGAKCNIGGSYYLIQGVRYEVGIDNVTGYPGGSFTCTVVAPSLSARATRYVGDNCSTSANASIEGNRLTINLAGSNSSWYTTHTHKAYAWLMSTSGATMYGPWTLSCSTKGWMLRGPTSNSNTGSWDISGFDLRGLGSIYLSVS